LAFVAGNAGVLTLLVGLVTNDPNELRGMMERGHRNWIAAG
jgi:hypothetical protein